MKKLETMKKSELIDLIQELVEKNKSSESVCKDYREQCAKANKKYDALEQRFKKRCEEDNEKIHYLKEKVAELTEKNRALDERIARVANETKVVANRFQKTFEEIAHNPRTVGKVMSEGQLRALMKFVSIYEITIEIPVGATVSWASDKIQSLDKQIKSGVVKARPKKYNPEELLKKYIEKHPEVYQNIVNRNL